MSNGSPHRNSSSVEPHATIGAQSLVQSQPDHYGFLRKRGQKERLLENLHLSRHINWRQRFVAIKDGSCYCYSDEMSKTPKQSFSLEGYNRISRASSDRATFVFSVEPDNTSRKKIHVFAASSDNDRLAWMQKFREAMCTANNVEPTPIRSSLTDAKDIFEELEKLVYTPAYPGLLRESDSRYSDEEEEESDDDGDYDCLEEDFVKTLKGKESMQRRTLPLPPVPQNLQSHGVDSSAPTPPKRKEALLPRPKLPTPGGSGGGGGSGGSWSGGPRPPETWHRPALPVPTSPREVTPPEQAPRPKPQPPVPGPTPKAKPAPPAVSKKPFRRQLSEKDSLFDNSDREAAIKILRDSKDPGTFLIRKSRQGDSKVLVVMTSEDVKEYKIFSENHQVSLDKKTFFSSVDDLLVNYSKVPLPNRQQTLTRPFNSSSFSH